ncbi:UNVERIFIED_CONTAM: hypothetical protein GTU68_045064 [Idotea baltica]|nr:hypothetical protein [Idotea baltica]
MRIIPAIDIIDGKCVRLSRGDFNRKTIYNDNPVEVAKAYEDNGIKYLHLVDLDGAKNKHIINHHILYQIATVTKLSIDFGGGIKSNEDIKIAFENGAQQITGGSIAVSNPRLFQEWVNRYGAEKIILGADCNNEKIATNGWQHTILAIDSKNTRQLDRVFVNGGKKETSWTTLDWAKKGQELGAGEILLTSMDHDGTKSGFALSLYRQIDEALTIPIIASGGAGNMEDFKELFSQTNISAGLAASIFHYHESSILEIKKYLANYKIPMR